MTALLAAQAQAQPTTTTAARPDPLDPKAQVPAMRYESSLGQSRRSGDDKPLAWRDANDAVARIGGWRVYAREAQQPDAPPSTPPAVAPAQSPASTPAAATKPAPAGHGGHKP
ncbi:hypothetical protein [Ramlibacter sp.]|uniref:hypothetical protein n=1 Tax=Ramlibacter sp. TaxID=1917967 RepID=UPI003D14A749